jgi:hypothetical protein
MKFADSIIEGRKPIMPYSSNGMQSGCPWYIEENQEAKLSYLQILGHTSSYFPHMIPPSIK